MQSVNGRNTGAGTVLHALLEWPPTRPGAAAGR
jgi:hypothetical protein